MMAKDERKNGKEAGRREGRVRVVPSNRRFRCNV